MNINKRTIAATQLVLLIPAALFMLALVARTLGPLQLEPAQTAQQIVMWYAGRMWTLWVLLLALPMAALVSGCAALLWTWKDGTEARQSARQAPEGMRLRGATLIIAAATLAAGVMLAVVVVHMLMN
jgi:hypothetical protein